MGLGIKGAAVPALAGAELTRTAHATNFVTVALTGENTFWNAGSPTGSVLSMFNNQGLAASWVSTNGRDVKQMRPSLVSGQLSSVQISQSFGVPFTGPDFADGGVGALDVSKRAIQPYCTNFAAWLRKATDVGEPETARAFFGFGNVSGSPLGATKTVPRVGLIGDGLLGFRFGSVNCPDGAPGTNGFADIDAGSVQPASLVNPGLKWFHVRIKVFPAQPTGELGTVACYLNEQLVVFYNTVTNLPRGFNGADQRFRPLNAFILADFDAVTQLNGLMVWLPEWWLDRDYSL